MITSLMRVARRFLGRHHIRLAAAVSGLLVCIAIVDGVASTEWYSSVRERAFDVVLVQLAEIPATAAPLVVDIDRQTLAAWNSGRLERGRLAELLKRIADEKPAAIGIDVLITGDGEGPASLARALIAGHPDPEIAGLAERLPDVTTELAKSVKQGPIVLGLSLSPEPSPDLGPTAPILMQGRLVLPEIWVAEGALEPPASVSVAARGLGVLALAADSDGNIRRVPLLVLAGERAVPGLAVEVLRIAENASTLVVRASPPSLLVGAREVPLDADAMLRLAPLAAQQRTGHTVSALSILDGSASAALRDRIILVGSSAPELGGLRTAHGGMLAASVELHAAAIAQMRSGLAPRRLNSVANTERVAAKVLAALAVVAGIVASPLYGTLISLFLASVWTAGALGAFAAGQHLVDLPLGIVAIMLSFATAALVRAAETWRRRVALQRRFEQHLSPEVVRRLVADPGLLKLNGEARVVTVMFTDIEGFTSMTERVAPEDLVSALDRYFEGIGQIVVAHGGMVDKFVGDGAHILFNAPVDLPDHTQHALEAAMAITAFSDRFRALPEAMAIGFGRTRVGIESGPVIIGDVGGGRKLDYTAYGNAVNAAARLESANKELATTICLGAAAAANLPGDSVRPLGMIDVRGRSKRLEVFEPWPAGYPPQDRAAFRAAAARLSLDAAKAIEDLEALVARHPRDEALRRFIERSRLRSAEALPASP